MRKNLPVEGRHAYATLLYGPQCHNYFLGALVLGEGLLLGSPMAQGLPSCSAAFLAAPAS